jgi:hypothetical protein
MEPDAAADDEPVEVVVIDVKPVLVARRKEVTNHLRKRRIVHEWHGDELHVPVEREGDTDALLAEIEASPPAFEWTNEIALAAAWGFAGIALSVGWSYDSDGDAAFPWLLICAPLCWAVVAYAWRTVPLARPAALFAALGVVFALFF